MERGEDMSLDSINGGDLSFKQDDEPVTCNERFAFELWKIILSFLHDADINQLWKCRLVCRDIKILTDEILKKQASVWNPSMDTLWHAFLRQVKGTRFGSRKDVDRFLTDFQGYRGNPFPNGRVIIINNSEDNHQTLRKLATRFRNEISSLIYTVSGPLDVDEITQLVCIFKLPNLKSLVIQKVRWNFLSMTGVRLLQELVDFNKFEELTLPMPKGLKEIQLFGVDSYLPVSHALPLFGSVVKSLESVRFSCLGSPLPPSHNHIQNKLFGPLKYSFKRLKIVQPTKPFLNSLLQNMQTKTEDGDGLRPLKEISFKFLQYQHMEHFRIGERIGQLFQTLDVNNAYKNLQLIYLEIDKEMMRPVHDRNLTVELALEPEINPKMKYENVKHLILNISILSKWEQLVKDLSTKKIVNLKKVTILMDLTSLGRKTPKEFHDSVISTYWKLLPEGTQIIHVPFFGWTLRRDQLQSPDFRL